MPKTVEQCRKYATPYLNTLNRTKPYLNTLTRTIPYLNTLSPTIPYLITLSPTIPYLNTLNRTIPYLNTLNPTLRHGTQSDLSHQPLRIEYYVTRELSARVEVTSRLSARLGSPEPILKRRDQHPPHLVCSLFYQS